MNFKVPILRIVFLICVSNASLIPTVKVLQGPSSKTLLLGPDGGVIDSAAPGGTVVTDDHGSGLVAAGPAVLPLGPQIVVNGPAGSIATSYTHAGPAVVPAVAPVSISGVVPAAASGGVIAGSVLGVGGGLGISGHGGLYDDGSYRGEY